MKFKKIFPIAIILISIGVVGYIAFGNQEIGRASRVLVSLNPIWLSFALLSWFAYVFFDGLTYYSFLKSQGHKIKLKTAVYLAFIGFYYCDITPGASGGQPMQVYEMSKRGIPTGTGTSAVLVRFIVNQLATTVIAVVLWALNGQFVRAQLGPVMTFIIIGITINALSIPVVILAVIIPSWIKKLCTWCINIGVKLRWVKNKESAEQKAYKVIDDYRESFKHLIKQPRQIVYQFFIAVCCMLGLFFVTYFVYRAFGYYGVPWMKLLTASALLYVSASYTPLPGASGAQEGGFMLYFSNIFSTDTIGLALLMWRFITFYLFLLIGSAMTIVNQIRSFMRNRKNKEDEVIETDNEIVDDTIEETNKTAS